jgi:hypothetical protein
MFAGKIENIHTTIALCDSLHCLSRVPFLINFTESENKEDSKTHNLQSDLERLLSRKGNCPMLCGAPGFRRDCFDLLSFFLLSLCLIVEEAQRRL